MVGSDVGAVEVARCGCVGCVSGRSVRCVLGFADSKQTYTTHTTSKRTLRLSSTFLISSSGSTSDPSHAYPAPLPNSIGSH